MSPPLVAKAHRLFRRAFRKADWKAGDLKHLGASLLPACFIGIWSTP